MSFSTVMQCRLILYNTSYYNKNKKLCSLSWYIGITLWNQKSTSSSAVAQRPHDASIISIRKIGRGVNLSNCDILLDFLQLKTVVIHALKYLKVWSKICKWFGHGSSLNLKGDEFSLCQSTRDLLTFIWLPKGVIDIFLIPNVRRLKDLANDT